MTNKNSMSCFISVYFPWQIYECTPDTFYDLQISSKDLTTYKANMTRDFREAFMLCKPDATYLFPYIPHGVYHSVYVYICIEIGPFFISLIISSGVRPDSFIGKHSVRFGLAGQ